MTDERREHTRYKVAWAARVLLPNRSIHPATVKDVSAGGVYIEVDCHIRIGTEINIELRPYFNGETHQIRAKGIITYNAILSDNRGHGYGLKFSLIGQKDHLLLNDIIYGLKN